MGDLAVVYLILFGCFAVPFVIGALIARLGLVWLVALLAVICFGVMVWALIKGEAAQGWDGLGYGIVAMIFAAPTSAGFAAGGAFGWWKWQRKREN